MPSLEFLHYSYSPHHMTNTPDSLATVDTQKLQGVRNKEVEMQPPKAAWLGRSLVPRLPSHARKSKVGMHSESQ